MIYHAHWGSVGTTPRKTMYGEILPAVDESLANFIKTSEEDSFIFIISNKVFYRRQLTNGQINETMPLDDFENWLRKYDLEKLIVLRTGLVINPVHVSSGPALTMFVLATPKHVMREFEL